MEAKDVVEAMTKHEIPVGCFGHISYESDETFDMMQTIFFPILPILTTLILQLTNFPLWDWGTQVELLGIIWGSLFIIAWLWGDVR
jgi:hypothetical protein